jgi:hypothetical protein
VFEKHKAKKARHEYEAALATWQVQHDELAAVLDQARSGSGMTSDVIVLKKGETVFGSVTGVGLIELRKGAGHWQGGSSGISVPIGKVGGRSIRYHVGATRGHYVQGTPHPEAVDRGTMYVTNQRIVFVGSSRTTECPFTKLVSVQRHPGELAVAVSSRQRPTVLHYGPALDHWVALRLDLALSTFNGEADRFAQNLAAQLAELEACKPHEPTALSPA